MENKEEKDVQFVICGCCGHFMAFGGYDISCDECGECDWQPSDENDRVIPK